MTRRLRPFCPVCGWRMGGPDSWNGTTCKCRLSAPPMSHQPEEQTMPKSYAPEVIADSTGKYCGNMLRFATREEAEGSAYALFQRWTLCTGHRAVESDDPVNYKRVDGRDMPIDKAS